MTERIELPSGYYIQTTTWDGQVYKPDGLQSDDWGVKDWPEFAAAMNVPAEEVKRLREALDKIVRLTDGDHALQTLIGSISLIAQESLVGTTPAPVENGRVE